MKQFILFINYKHILKSSKLCLHEHIFLSVKLQKGYWLKDMPIIAVHVLIVISVTSNIKNLLCLFRFYDFHLFKTATITIR